MAPRACLAAVAALMFASSASAHIVLANPVIYSADQSKSDNGPITASNFPCKTNYGFKVSQENQMAVGSKQTASFAGTAVHGGGSCQLSVTLDREPTKDSVFKVIKSIEGGCPGTDGSTSTYDFELPASIPNGQATFAWTWFARLSGAPEMYMNCAPITVSGGASDKTAFNALPDMFVANIASTDCKSPANEDVLFPNPGSVVEKGGDGKLAAPTGSQCGAAASGGSGSGGSASTSKAAGGSGGSATTSKAGGGSGASTIAPSATSNPGGIFAPGASSAASSTATSAVASSAVATAPDAGSPSSPTATSMLTTLITKTASASGGSGGSPVETGTAAIPSAVPTSGTGGGSSTGGTSTCSTDGAVVCNGTSQFGLCNHGQVVWQGVAAGTECKNGAIGAISTKRNVIRRSLRGRFARSYGSRF